MPEREAQPLKSRFHRAGDLVTRYGGQEFAVLVAGVGPTAPMSLANHCAPRSSKCRSSLEPRRRQAPPRFSIGVATMMPDGNEGAATLLKAADEALYAAKNAGRNRMVCMPPSAPS